MKKKPWQFIENEFSPIYNADFVFLYCPSLRCNYTCYYCYQKEWDNQIVKDEEYKIQKKFIHYIESITSKKRNMDLYGGEFLYNIDIFEFFDEFYDNWQQFRLFTNLSHDIKLFEKLIQYDKLHYVISFHPHQIKNLNEFIEKLDLLYNNKKKIEFRIMFDANQKNKIETIIEYFKNKPEVFLTIRNIYGYSYDKELYEYYKSLIQNEDYFVKYNSKKIKIREFLNMNIKSFGSKCTAGKSELVLSYDGNVYPCETLMLKNKRPLFNIYKNNWKNFKLLNLFICPLEQCRCDWFLK